MDFFDVVKNIGSVLGLFLSTVSVAGVITKLLSKRYDRLFDEHLEEIRKNDKKQTEEITEIKDTLNNLATEFGSVKTEVGSIKTEVGSLKTEVSSLKIQVDSLEKRFDVVEDFNAEVCRNVIKDIYYKYNKTQKIPLYERKIADSLYKIYSEQFHQNSYGQLLYQEICKWEIDPTDKLTM